MTLPVVILAGGLATRLRPVTEKIPKSLIEVAGKPFAELQIELLVKHNIKKVVFCIGYLGEMIRDTLGDGKKYGIQIKYSFDGDILLGTGGSIRKALPLIGDTFFILYGDSYLDCDYQKIEESFYQSKKEGLMTVFHNRGLFDRSNIIFRDGQILQYKKGMNTEEFEYIDYGLGILRSSILKFYPENTPFDLSIVYQNLLAKGNLAGYEVPHRFYEIGSKEGLEETRKMIDNII